MGIEQHQDNSPFKRQPKENLHISGESRRRPWLAHFVVQEKGNTFARRLVVSLNVGALYRL